MKCSRKWAMPNKNTFTIIPIKNLIEIYHNGLSIDPFANTSRLATINNDLNPEYECESNLDAGDFLKSIKSNSVDFVFYDPPYSVRQVSECYKNVGIEVTQEMTRSDWFTKHKIEIRRVLKTNGIVICFGWNSNGIGGPDMKMIEFLLVAHGGVHNDTIVTVEKKIQNTFSFDGE